MVAIIYSVFTYLFEVSSHLEYFFFFWLCYILIRITSLYLCEKYLC